MSRKTWWQQKSRATLEPLQHCCPARIPFAMTPIRDMDDHDRLSERFYGAARSVLARLADG